MTTTTTPRKSRPKTEAALAAEHDARSIWALPRYDQKPDAPAIAAARRDLRRMLPPGSTVYTTIAGAPSRSGMSRHLRLFIIRNNKPVNITAQAARAMGDKTNERQGEWTIRADGCGMDMGFHTVYSLSCNLYPRGFKTSKKAPARNGAPVGSRDPDGGYALQQRWL